MSDFNKSRTSLPKPPGLGIHSNSSSDSVLSLSKSNKLQKKISNLMFHPNRKSSDDDDVLSNSTLTDLLPVPTTNTGPSIPNVEFNNVRASLDGNSYSNSNSLSHVASNTTSIQELRSRASSTTLSKFPRLMGLGLGKDKRQQQQQYAQSEAGSETQSLHHSVYDLPKHVSTPVFGTFAAKLKKTDNLSIQAALQPSSKEVKSIALSIISKEIERIANFSLQTQLDRNGGTSGSNGKQKYKPHILRSKKDNHGKSSAFSNSDVGGHAMYSFHPNNNNIALTFDELRKNLDVVDFIDPGAEIVADEAWMTLSSLINPLFKCERLSTPIEEINRLAFIHIKLRKSQTETTSNQIMSAIQSPVVPAFQSHAQSMQSPTTSWITPLTVPTPTFVTQFTQSPTSMQTSIASSSQAVDEIQEKLKMGMDALRVYIQVDESTKEVRLNPIVHNSYYGNHRNSTASKRPPPGSNSVSQAVTQYFEKSCLALWEYFYNDVFFQLCGILLPLEEELTEESSYGPHSASLTASSISTFPPLPSSSSGGVGGVGDVTLTPTHAQYTLHHHQSINSMNTMNPTAQSYSIRDMILISYRDNVVIPLYEQNRQMEKTDRENRRRDNTTGSNMSAETKRLLGGDHSIIVEEDLPMHLSLLQCFTILCGVQTNDTNQKIIENLMHQTRDKCRVLESNL